MRPSIAQAVCDAVLRRADQGLWAVAAHRPGVAEAKIKVRVSVDVRYSSTGGVSRVDRKAASPACHPRHGHAAHERFQRPLMQAPRAGMQFDEA